MFIVTIFIEHFFLKNLQFSLRADLYTFRNLADAERDLFKALQTFHNRKSIHRKNNFIYGNTFETIDGIKTEKVSVRLMPHQVFIFPLNYLYRLINRETLKNETGMEFYSLDQLGYVVSLFFWFLNQGLYWTCFLAL